MLKNKLKSFRTKHEMNQTEFAAYLGIDRYLYNRWESHAKEPSLGHWAMLDIKLFGEVIIQIGF